MQIVYIEVKIKIDDIVRVPLLVDAAWSEGVPQIMGVFVENENAFNKDEIAIILAQAEKQEDFIIDKLIEASIKMADFSWDVY